MIMDSIPKELKLLSGCMWNKTWVGCHYDLWRESKDEMYLFLENIHENVYRTVFEDYDFKN